MSSSGDAQKDEIVGQAEAIRKHVLVVEDEPLLLLMAGDVVEQAGFRPLFAHNADEAIAVLERYSDVAAIFTDVDMPGSMNGMRLAAAVRDRWPPVAILVTSGHAVVPDRDLPACSRFFRKPYLADQVADALRNLTR